MTRHSGSCWHCSDFAAASAYLFKAEERKGFYLKQSVRLRICGACIGSSTTCVGIRNIAVLLMKILRLRARRNSSGNTFVKRKKDQVRSVRYGRSIRQRLLTFLPFIPRGDSYNG